MVWNCMCAEGLGTLHLIEALVNAAKYQDFHEHLLLPSAAKLYSSGDIIFQQDGASCHSTESTKTSMSLHYII